MEEKRTLIVYDISDDKKRYRVVKILESYGERVQNSVFEMYLDRRQWREIITKIKEYIDDKEDSFRMYDLSMCKKEEHIGRETTVENNGCIIV